MRKFVAFLAAVLCGATSLLAQKGDSDELVRFVPAGTNVILYVNTANLFKTNFMNELRANNSKIDFVVDGIMYNSERLNLGKNALNALMLCRDTAKATSSFYLLDTTVPEANFSDIYVADYGFFNSASETSIEIVRQQRKRKLTLIELTRKGSATTYVAAYLGKNIVTIIPNDATAEETFEALISNPPVSGEVATVAGTMIKDKILAGIIVSLKNRDTVNTWDHTLDGLVFAEITLSMPNEKDVNLTARFYCDAANNDAAANVAKFIAVLRHAKEDWLNTVVGRQNEELYSKLDSAIKITMSDRRVQMEVKLQEELLKNLYEVDPKVVIDLLNTTCEKFQLLEPELPVGSIPAAVPAPTAAALSSSEDLF